MLNLRLTVADTLPQFSRHSLQKEVESIWRNDHVQLRWVGTDASPAPALTILVTPTTLAPCCADNAHWTVGQLRRFNATTAIALASIAGAERVVNETRRFSLLDLPTVYEHRLGVVLGRAVAHEIGHYILRTNTHAQYGLMRANVDVREFADLGASTFRLDAAAEAYLASVASNGRLVAGSQAKDGFSY